MIISDLYFSPHIIYATRVILYIMIGVKIELDDNKVKYLLMEGTSHAKVIFDETDFSIQKIEDLSEDRMDEMHRKATPDGTPEKLSRNEIPDMIKREVKDYW